MVGVSNTTIFKILYNHLGMNKTIWCKQKQRVDNDSILSLIVSRDETRFIITNLSPSKTQCGGIENVYKHQAPKKFKMPQSVGKIMAVIFLTVALNKVGFEILPHPQKSEGGSFDIF